MYKVENVLYHLLLLRLILKEIKRKLQQKGGAR